MKMIGDARIGITKFNQLKGDCLLAFWVHWVQP